MTVIIDGKTTAANIVSEIKAESENLGIKPGLAVLLVGDDPASSVYVRNKERACDRAGMIHRTYKLPSSTTENQVLSLIKDLENDCEIHGIIVQLPLPKHINEEKIINSIPIMKDVDCFHPMNVGNIMTKKKDAAPVLIAPCTPAGVIELLDRHNVSIAGKNVVVVGRSNIVGKPLALMLLNRDATVTIAHSRSSNLSEITRRADILIAAVGVPKLIKEDMVKENAVVIDVGTNRLDSGQLVGDVDFDKIKEKSHAITPVPGGVGPMTIAMLLKNTLIMAKRIRSCDK